MPRRKLLNEPVSRATRLVALDLLDGALRGAHHFRKHRDDDDDALHKFRVAVRRLRSWLQLWKTEMSDSVSGHRRRQIRDIAADTGPARDLEVHVAWLRRERRRLRGRDRDAIDTLIAHFAARAAKALDLAADAAAKLDDVRDAISTLLSQYCAAVRSNPRRDGDRFDQTLAARVSEAARELHDCLAKIRSRADHEEIHEARIAAKRLRYLLEPVTGEAYGAGAIVKDLEALQEIAGDSHDVHVFLEEIGPPSAEGDKAPPVLMHHLQQRGKRAYSALKRDWLGRESEVFFERVERVAARLAPATSGSLAGRALRRDANQ